MKLRNVKEAVDVKGVPQFFHPSKIAKIQAGVPPVEGIMPEELSPSAQRYLELITSKSYEDVLKKIKHYTGKEPTNMKLPQVTASVMAALSRIVAVEKQHVSLLKKFALDTVLSLPEFELARKAVEKGYLKFDLKLGVGTPSLKDAREMLEDAERELEMDDQPEDPNELTETEEIDREIVQGFSETEMRRRLARVILQGNAINKFYIFNLLADNLEEMDPDLVNLYGIACSHIHLLYYAMPEMDMDPENAEGMAQGSCQVIDHGNGTHTIKASGVILPYLIHEIVKCIYDYFAVDIAPQDVLDKQQLGDEIVEFLSGPDAYKTLIKYIDYADHNTIPIVFRKFLRLPINKLKDVLRGGDSAKAIINRLVQEAKYEIRQHAESEEQANAEEEEPYRDGGGDYMDGGDDGGEVPEY